MCSGVPDLCFQYFSAAHFLIQVLYTFGILCAVMGGITLLAPLREPVTLPEREDMRTSTSPVTVALGALVILGVIAFTAVFW